MIYYFIIIMIKLLLQKDAVFNIYTDNMLNYFYL